MSMAYQWVQGTTFFSSGWKMTGYKQKNQGLGVPPPLCVCIKEVFFFSFLQVYVCVCVHMYASRVLKPEVDFQCLLPCSWTQSLPIWLVQLTSLSWGSPSLPFEPYNWDRLPSKGCGCKGPKLWSARFHTSIVPTQPAHQPQDQCCFIRECQGRRENRKMKKGRAGRGDR